MTLPIRYSKLDYLPRRLRLPVVVHLHGHLEERIASLVEFRTALLRGRLPDAADVRWPSAVLLTTALDSLSRSGVVPLCKGRPELTDEVLLTLLESVVASERFMEAACAHFLSLAITERATREGILLPPNVVSNAEVCASHGRRLFDAETLEKVRRDARALAAEMACKKLSVHLSDRARRADAIRELGLLLDDVAPRGWDWSHVGLHLLAGADTGRIRAVLGRLRQLHGLVAAIGRSQHAPHRAESAIFERVSGPMRRPVVRLDKRIPYFAPDLRGVERADDVARMLPCEAASLLHPQLRLVWHARRAERALLCYRAEGSGLIETEEGFNDGETVKRRPGERGPMLVCLDTSGSMAGSAALLAQAVVLHLALVAHEEGRGCHVFSFSGPGDVVEHDLGFDADAIEHLLAFLLLTFEGGTDVSEPLRRALDLYDEKRWRNADVLIVSDGAFEAPNEILARLRRERSATGLRVHGLLIGNYSADAMSEICSHVHRLSDWVNQDRS
jgi:uncharacterized protein with von Willebrand factor type A (vWA) domain